MQKAAMIDVAGSSRRNVFTPSGPKPTVVFLHIPKTAGQTIFSEMQRIVGSAAISPVRTHTQVAPDAQLPSGFRVHSGHIDWVDLETLPENRFAFTVLRDPHERIASFYFYLLQEAKKLAPDQLDLPENTGKRVILSCPPEEYFFGGDKNWQRFVRDHYDNFYANYFATRRIRGWSALKDLSEEERLSRAITGAGAIDRIYSVDDLAPLERDLKSVLGKRVKLTGNYLNTGPQKTHKSRWEQLVGLFADPSTEERLDAFTRIDQELMRRLRLGETS